jgi:pimeloyl-ACP methyl ester carboxylesterase
VENYLTQIEEVFVRTGLEDAVVIGVSFSGPVAAEFTTRHPDKVRGLVLVSALPVDWVPDARARFYLRAPRLLSPVFLLDAPSRAYREIRSALPDLSDRARFSAAQFVRVTRYFLSPSRMAARITWFSQFNFSDPAQIARPVMVITGEPGLDRVVPPALSERYVAAIPHARRAVIPRTGHLGCITKPHEFADHVATFVNEVIGDVRRASA